MNTTSKKILFNLFLVFIFPFLVTAQNMQKEWEKVYSLELNGQSKTALDLVTKIHTKALKNKDDINQIKSFIYIDKYSYQLFKEYKTTVYNKFLDEIKTSSEISKTFLYQYLITKLIYKFDENTFHDNDLKDVDENDFHTWNNEKIIEKIYSFFELSVLNKQAVLEKTPVDQYKELFTKIDVDFEDQEMNLYQLFIKNHIIKFQNIYFRDGLNVDFSPTFFLNTQDYLKTDLSFIRDKQTYIIAKLYQQLEATKFLSKNNYTLNRIKYFYDKFEKTNDLKNVLIECKEYYKNVVYQNTIRFLIASCLNETATKENDFNHQALDYLKDITKEDPELFQDAYRLKQKIISQNINTKLLKKVYPKQNLRAFIEYKNCDSILVSYYKLEKNTTYHLGDDKGAIEHINRHKPIQAFFRTLPKSKNFLTTSTEVLLEPFEAGEYLVVVGSPLSNKNYQFNYEFVTCTNIKYVTFTNNNSKVLFFREANTGRPITNTNISIDKEIYKTNNQGKITLPLTYFNGNTSKHLICTYKNDILEENLGSTYSDYDTIGGINIDANVFFDKGIYRPGHKVYFKGIVTQTNEYQTTVAPQLSLGINIKNEKGETIKTYNLKTNDFGSFSGEFEIQKNGPSGQYTLEIVKPKEYQSDTNYISSATKRHSVWESYEDDFSRNFNFQVEEYKKPTFKIELEPITSDLQIGKVITLKGVARNFYGAPVANAHLIANTKYDQPNDYKRHLESQELETSADGSFSINIDTKLIKTVKDNFLFFFQTVIEITDVTGETQTATKTFTINKQPYYLDIDIQDNLTDYKAKKIKIKALNTEKAEKKVTGKIEIKKIIFDTNALVRRTFDVPETISIDSLSFKKLFPYESYNEAVKFQSIKTINFESNQPETMFFEEDGDFIIEASSNINNTVTIKHQERIEIKNDDGNNKQSHKLYSFNIKPVTNTNQLKIEFESQIKDLFITCLNYSESTTSFKEEFIQLENGKGTLLINKPQNKLVLHCFTIFENLIYFNDYSNFFKNQKKPVTLEITSMRNKIEPGSTEKWQLKIINPNLDHEVLACMRDASVQAIAPYHWNTLELPKIDTYSNSYEQDHQSSYYNEDFYDIYLYNENSFRMLFEFKRNQTLNWFDAEITSNLNEISGKIIYTNKVPQSFYIKNLRTKSICFSDFYGNFTIEGKINDQLQITLGASTLYYKITNKHPLITINFPTEYSFYSKSEYISITSRFKILKSKPLLIDGKKVVFESSIEISESDAGREQINESSEREVKFEPPLLNRRKSLGFADSKPKNDISFETIKTRSNFKETAFFYPHITTEADGSFILNFTTPDQLTKWELELLAHNKNAESGTLLQEIVSQKPLMISPNMPRFVRENDILFVTAKISNLEDNPQEGKVQLLLQNEETGESLQKILLDKTIQKFNCAAQGTTIVQWKIKIPDNCNTLHYKILAQSGNYSDGEENIIPVLKNSVLVKEAVPVWVLPNNKASFTLQNLKTNSETKKELNVQFNLITNPIWSCLESLPYLKEYEHDCTEQLFSKFFANAIANKIIAQNPTIKTVLENWKNTATIPSKIKEELRGTLLSETPWLLENENEIKARISNLLHTEQLQSDNQVLLEKIKERQTVQGGFGWFSKQYENEYITRHLMSSIGHLIALAPEYVSQFEDITKKGIPYLDNAILKNKEHFRVSDLHYLYTRSFYLKTHPLSKKLKEYVNVHLETEKNHWSEKSLYEKTLLAMLFYRFHEKEVSRKIIRHLRETTISNSTQGMYWKENTKGYYWYQSPIELQTLLIEAFAEIDYKKEEIEGMKVWLVSSKQNKNWETTKATALAINALINYGSNWTSSKGNIVINNHLNPAIETAIDTHKSTIDSGAISFDITTKEIKNISTPILIENKSITPVYGGIYYQYFENIDKIVADSNDKIAIKKTVYKNDKEIKNQDVQTGDLLKVRLVITTKQDLEFVHIKDLRASCFEPTNIFSETKWLNNTYYFMATKDLATHFFFDSLPEGTYVLEYDVRVNNTGVFNNGIATLQSMYAPEFSVHSSSQRISVTNK